MNDHTRPLRYDNSGDTTHVHKQYVLPSIDLTISFVCGNCRTKRIQSGIFQKLHIFVFQVGLYALNICFLVTRTFRRYLFTKLPVS